MSGVLAIGRSDPLAHLEECRRRAARIRFIEFKRRFTDAEVDEAVAAVQSGAALDPGSRARGPSAILQHRRRITRASRRRSVAARRRRIAAADRAKAHDAAGRASINPALRIRPSGADPRRELEAGIAALQRALADSASTPVNNALANAMTLRANYEERIGNDGSPYVRTVIEHYQRALDLAPSFKIAHSNLGTAYVLLADRTLRAGRDPAPLLEQAIRHLNEGVQAMPDNVSAATTSATRFSQAEYSSNPARTPSRPSPVSAARSSSSRLRAAALQHRVRLRIVAEDRQKRGLDASAHIKDANAALDRYDAMSPAIRLGDPSRKDRAGVRRLRSRLKVLEGIDTPEASTV
jgi:tetratricopeptide (TPR) repeat protein